jgi:ESS family glutamate:Na+ symporter
MKVVLSFSFLCLLLLLGKFLRMRIKLFQKLYLPSSVIAGFLGLAILQIFGSQIPADYTAGWSKLPGFLINIVFAALFLGISIPPLSTIWKKSGPQFVYGQIVAWGQYSVGIGVAILVLKPLFSLPGFFGTLVPVGFEGGHGTAAGLGKTFETLNWSQGLDFALASATAGIVSAIIVGMILINWAVRKNITKKGAKFESIPESSIVGVYNPKQRPPAGYQTVSADSVDSLALHLAIIGVSIFIGYGLRELLLTLEHVWPALAKTKLLAAFPLFPLCMIGGLIVQLVLSRIIKVDLIDHQLTQRLSGTALDFLVVAAISTIRLSVIMKGFLPFIILIAVAIAWNVFCLLFLARKILPDAWFERGIVEMGQSMGTTATGLMLLRVVDPEAETPAYSAFGYKQLLHEPFMGGGLWTSIAIPLAIVQGPGIVFWISLGAIFLWGCFWWCAFRRTTK